jgi:membrane protease YdiL (CAAX protease family)
MQTPIGNRLGRSRRLGLVCGFVAAAVVLADLGLVWRGFDAYSVPRAVPPLVALAAYLGLARGDRASVGLTIRPIQGFRYWVGATLLIGLAVGSFILATVATLKLLGQQLPIHATPPGEIGPAFVRMCLLAPIYEEATYRLGLCTGATPSLKPWGTVAVGGLAFGGLHVLYGNPGPDNLIAGFFLSWAYLKSGSILVPLVLHSLGNLLALSAHVGAWYWLISRA